MTEIAQGVAAAYRCTAEVGFSDYCPCMVVDHALAGNAMTYMTELVGQGAMDMSKLTGGKPGGGSEDFAFVSHEAPFQGFFGMVGGQAGQVIQSPPERTSKCVGKFFLWCYSRRFCGMLIIKL